MNKKIAIIGMAGHSCRSIELAAKMKAAGFDVVLVKDEDLPKQNIEIIDDSHMFIDPAPLLKYNYQAPEKPCKPNKRTGNGGKKNKRNHKY